jgi:2-polyprenyl-6-methoxyphenol hydroxylase-like FAD-dependent oxidoreductase
MKINNQQIAIIGGGPGGLTLARLLQLKGANVKVYERDANRAARLIGSPLDMHEGSGLAAIRKAELLEEFKKNFRAGADRKVITNEKAEIFLSDHDSKPEEDFGNAHFRPEIDRSPLRDLFLDSLQPGTMVWDSHFVSMEREKEGWRLHFKNGTSAYADLVVAADGANSKIRPYITPIKAFYSGVTMVEINVHDASRKTPGISALLNGGKVMAFGNGHCMLGGQKHDDEIGFYASLKVDEKWSSTNKIDYSDRKQLLNWFEKEFSGWSDNWFEIFENADTPVIPRPIYCIPFDQVWQSLPNVTMIGDAAHVMPPFAGEGANMAMLDALELSEQLTSDKYPSQLEAITAYETEMRQRGAIAAKESLENGERMHAQNALEVMLGFFAKHGNPGE